MPTYEIPTHLHVSDRVIAGLTWHQLLVLGAGLACAFWLWRTVPLRGTPGAALAAAPLLAALACALVRLDGHDLVTWLALVAIYALTPHRMVWRREAAAIVAPCVGPVRWTAHVPATLGAVGARMAWRLRLSASLAGLLALPMVLEAGGPHSGAAGRLPGPARGGRWRRAVAPLLGGRLICLSTHHQCHAAPEQAS